MSTFAYQQIIELLNNEDIDTINTLLAYSQTALSDIKLRLDNCSQNIDNNTIYLSNNELLNLYATSSYLSINESSSYNEIINNYSGPNENIFIRNNDYFEDNNSEADKLLKIIDTFNNAVVANLNKATNYNGESIYDLIRPFFINTKRFIELSEECNEEELTELNNNLLFKQIELLFNYLNDILYNKAKVDIIYLNRFFRGYYGKELNSGDINNLINNYDKIINDIQSFFTHNEKTSIMNYLHNTNDRRDFNFLNIWRGAYGEAQVFDFISRNLPFMKCLTNIRVPIINQNYFSENDCILVSNKGVFTIEVKSKKFKSLTVDKSGDVTEEFNYDNSLNKGKNIVEQCNTHANDLANLLAANNIIEYKTAFNMVHGICVITNSTTIIKNNTSTPVLKLNTEIINYIKNSDDIITDEQVDQIVSFLNEVAVPASKYEYNDNTIFTISPLSPKQDSTQDLGIKLKDYSTSGKSTILSNNFLDNIKSAKENFEEEQKRLRKEKARQEVDEYNKQMKKRNAYFMKWNALFASLILFFMLIIQITYGSFIDWYKFNILKQVNHVEIDSINLVVNPILKQEDIDKQILLNTKIHPYFNQVTNNKSNRYEIEPSEITRDGEYIFNKKEFVEVIEMNNGYYYVKYTQYGRNQYSVKRTDQSDAVDLTFDINAPIPSDTFYNYEFEETKPIINIAKVSDEMQISDKYTMEEEALKLTDCFTGKICYEGTNNCTPELFYFNHFDYNIEVNEANSTAIITLSDGKTTMTITNLLGADGSSHRGVIFNHEGCEPVEMEISEVFRVNLDE